MIIKAIYFWNYLHTNRNISRMKKKHHTVLTPMLPPASYIFYGQVHCLISL